MLTVWSSSGRTSSSRITHRRHSAGSGMIFLNPRHIALTLMEMNMFAALGKLRSVRSTSASPDRYAVAADLVINKRPAGARCRTSSSSGPICTP